MAFILFPFIRQLKTLTDNAPPILRIVNATIMLGHFTPITFFIPKITADRLWFLRLHYYASVPSSLICTRRQGSIPSIKFGQRLSANSGYSPLKS